MMTQDEVWATVKPGDPLFQAEWGPPFERSVFRSQTLDYFTVVLKSHYGVETSQRRRKSAYPSFLSERDCFEHLIQKQLCEIKRHRDQIGYVERSIANLREQMAALGQDAETRGGQKNEND